MENAERALADLQDAAAAPAARRAGAAFDGAGKRVLLVGSNAERPFVLAEAVRTARALGVEVFLLDAAERRGNSRELIDDAHFIPAPVAGTSAENLAAVAKTAAAFAKARAVAFDAVYSGLNAYAELAGVLVDALGAAGNPGQAVRAAHSKALARAALAGDPAIATPYRVVASPEEAARAVRGLGAARYVIKPARGAGSRGVMTGIATPEDAAAAYALLRADLDAWSRRPEAASHLLDGSVDIIVEAQLEGPEVDVELVLSRGELRFGRVSDNPPMDGARAVEKASTYPSQLSAEMQEQLLAAALRAAELLGLRDGNLHVELIYTRQGPKVVEVNARMGGAFVWESMLSAFGVSLVELGLRAVLGAPTPAALPAAGVVESRFFIPRVSGEIVAIEGLGELRARADVRWLKLWKNVGDAVSAEDGADYIGFASVLGESYDAAMDVVLEAFAQVKIFVRTAAGDIVEQSGAFSHVKAPVAEQWVD